MKFACVDGPEFDAHQVDFDELADRLTAYREQERARPRTLHRRTTSASWSKLRRRYAEQIPATA